MTTPAKTIAFPEFIALMAMMSSLMALSIDAMLPALPQIGHDLGVLRANDNQLIISSLFAGMALGLLFYGPLSDSFGRKPPLYIGLILFILGCLVSIFSHDFKQMLLGRLLQGIGLAAPRVVSLAMIRDQFQGKAMARVMSFVMMVFILVPALAPAMGQAILWVAPWQAIFGLFVLLSLVLLVWFALRQPETLALTHRTPFTLRKILQTLAEILRLRAALGPTIALGIVFGAFLGYLSTAQQIFQGLYAQGNRFALYFGLLALVFGGASLFNAKLVRFFSLRQLSKWTLLAQTIFSSCFFFFSQAWEGVPPFETFLLFLAASFVCVAILFGNLNALAMEPLGHIAGIGAAVVGTISTFISAGLGAMIGQMYDETLLPLAGGFAILGLGSLLILVGTTEEVLQAAKNLSAETS